MTMLSWKHRLYVSVDAQLSRVESCVKSCNEGHHAGFLAILLYISSN